MRVTHGRTTRGRTAVAALVAAALLGGCVQFGSGRGRGFPEDDHGTESEEIVPETGDAEGLEGSELEGDVGDESDEPAEAGTDG